MEGVPWARAAVFAVIAPALACDRPANTQLLAGNYEALGVLYPVASFNAAQSTTPTLVALGHDPREPSLRLFMVRADGEGRCGIELPAARLVRPLDGNYELHGGQPVVITSAGKAPSYTLDFSQIDCSPYGELTGVDQSRLQDPLLFHSADEWGLANTNNSFQLTTSSLSPGHPLCGPCSLGLSFDGTFLFLEGSSLVARDELGLEVTRVDDVSDARMGNEGTVLMERSDGIWRWVSRTDPPSLLDAGACAIDAQLRAQISVVAWVAPCGSRTVVADRGTDQAPVNLGDDVLRVDFIDSHTFYVVRGPEGATQGAAELVSDDGSSRPLFASMAVDTRALAAPKGAFALLRGSTEDGTAEILRTESGGGTKLLVERVRSPPVWLSRPELVLHDWDPSTETGTLSRIDGQTWSVTPLASRVRPRGYGLLGPCCDDKRPIFAISKVDAAGAGSLDIVEADGTVSRHVANSVTEVARVPYGPRRGLAYVRTGHGWEAGIYLTRLPPSASP